MYIVTRGLVGRWVGISAGWMVGVGNQIFPMIVSSVVAYSRSSSKCSVRLRSDIFNSQPSRGKATAATTKNVNASRATKRKYMEKEQASKQANMEGMGMRMP